MAETSVVNQFLTFTLADTAYALDVGNVREVLAMLPITSIPRAADFLRGVINVRGSVVPVVDLRLKLGMSRTEENVATSIIVLDIPVGDQQTVVGALVDSVQEVVDMEADKIEPPPQLGTAIDVSFIRGIGKRDERFILILDTARIFTEEEVSSIMNVEAEAPVK